MEFASVEASSLPKSQLRMRCMCQMQMAAWMQMGLGFRVEGGTEISDQLGASRTSI